MRHVARWLGLVALAVLFAWTAAAMGETAKRSPQCGQFCSVPGIQACADRTRDQSRDHDPDPQQDRDRDRICDCDNYADEDGDGFCDNCDCPGAPQDGTGKQHRGG